MVDHFPRNVHWSDFVLPKRDCKLSSKVCCMQKIVYTAKLKVGQSSFTRIGQKNQINSGYNRLNLVNLLKLSPNTPIWCILRGFSHEESFLPHCKEDPSARDKYNVLHVNWIQKTYGTRMIRLLGSFSLHVRSLFKPPIIFPRQSLKNSWTNGIEHKRTSVIVHRRSYTLTNSSCRPLKSIRSKEQILVWHGRYFSLK